MNPTRKQIDIAALQCSLVQAIFDFVKDSPLNRLADIDQSPIFEEPLVGFVAGDDPLFEVYKNVVHPEFMQPGDILRELAAASADISALDQSRAGIVSWILPVAKPARLENRCQSDGPGQRWNHTRIRGEAFNDELRKYVTRWLQEKGFLAVAPVTLPGFKTDHLEISFASTWSERHVAYAAGLGTFSLSDGLITARGIAHRCGSVLANVAWNPSPRPYTQPREYCAFDKNGACGLCIQRCPAGAISANGHDKDRCEHFIFTTLIPWTQKPGYIGPNTGCGLCQTGVPCENGIPVQVKKRLGVSIQS